jgi:hypothetical protein
MNSEAQSRYKHDPAFNPKLPKLATLAGTAYAGDDQRADRTWPSKGDVTVCDGLLTSNNVCIGSESNVDEPDDHGPLDGRTIVVRPDRD